MVKHLSRRDARVRRREPQGPAGRFLCEPSWSGFAKRCGQPRSMADSSSRNPESSRLHATAASGAAGWSRKPYCCSFRSQRGGALSHDGLAYVAARHPAVSRTACPSLRKKHLTPHVLRHTAAMELLQNGVDRSVIALRLGRESVETTCIHRHADLALKEKAMARTAPGEMPPERYGPEDEVPAFLNAL